MKNFIRLIITILILGTLYSCGNSTEPKTEPQDVPSTSDSSKVTAQYICPCGTCGFNGDIKPGECPKCGMDLELKP